MLNLDLASNQFYDLTIRSKIQALIRLKQLWQEFLDFNPSLNNVKQFWEEHKVHLNTQELKLDFYSFLLHNVNKIKKSTYTFFNIFL